MSELSEADAWLLAQIREGRAEAWEELVQRYQGRLHAFALAQVRQAADAEDLVQETFLDLLRKLDQFRGEASLETYLYTILRRRIIDRWRGRGKFPACALAEETRPSEDLAMHTGSWHARLAEEQALRSTALATAIREEIDRTKTGPDLTELQVLELVFYCGVRNKQAADLADCTEQQVAMWKHRAIKRMRSRVEALLDEAGLSFAGVEADGWRSDETAPQLLRSVWETQRPSCPKRTTLGSMLLGTLDESWQKYVDFHVGTLGCHFCRASLADLRRQQGEAEQAAFRQRVMNSSVGFLPRGGPSR